MLCFKEYHPSGGLLIQVHTAFGKKGYPPSLAGFAFRANGTNVMSVITIRTIRLWYAGTIRQIPEISMCRAPVTLCSQASVPEHSGAKSRSVYRSGRGM